MRDEQQHSHRRSTAMPDSYSVEATERRLDRGQKGCENERAREEKERLGTAELAEESARGLLRRPGHQPQRDIRDRDEDEHDAAERRLLRAQHEVVSQASHYELPVSANTVNGD